MKKLLIATVAIILSVSTTFAAGTNATSAHNSAVSTEKFKRVGYVSQHVKYEDLYDLSGELIATTHAVAIEQLPTNAKRMFAKNFDGFTVKEAIQVDRTDETAYFISAQKENQSVILKVDDSGNVTIVKE